MAKSKNGKYDCENILDGTARLMFNVFNRKTGVYNNDYDMLMMSGGGGNSLFINCWQQASFYIDRVRISGDAQKRLKAYGYSSIEDAENRNSSFLHNNAKGAEKRRAAGKHLHADHNPGNKKVIEMIKQKCRSYNPDTDDYEKTISEIKEYLRTVQTIDWITVEQDDVRTYKDTKHTKKEKDLMTHEQRDELLHDTWKYLE